MLDLWLSACDKSSFLKRNNVITFLRCENYNRDLYFYPGISNRKKSPIFLLATGKNFRRSYSFESILQPSNTFLRAGKFEVYTHSFKVDPRSFLCHPLSTRHSRTENNVPALSSGSAEARAPGSSAGQIGAEPNQSTVVAAGPQRGWNVPDTPSSREAMSGKLSGPSTVPRRNGPFSHFSSSLHSHPALSSGSTTHFRNPPRPPPPARRHR